MAYLTLKEIAWAAPPVPSYLSRAVANTRKREVCPFSGPLGLMRSWYFQEAPLVPGSGTVKVVTSQQRIEDAPVTAFDDGEGSLILNTTKECIGKIHYENGTYQLLLPEPVYEGSVICIARHLEPFSYQRLTDSWELELSVLHEYFSRGGYATRQTRERYDRLVLKQEFDRGRSTARRMAHLAHMLLDG